eukprot:365638-Chlamydomonas_euryale.AAC.6
MHGSCGSELCRHFAYAVPAPRGQLHELMLTGVSVVTALMRESLSLSVPPCVIPFLFQSHHVHMWPFAHAGCGARPPRYC